MPDFPDQFDLRNSLGNIQELSTLPHVMLRIQELTEDPSAGARELGEQIAQDPSLTGKILKVANSAFYGRYGGVSSVPQAVVLLGFDEVRRLSLAVSVIGMFEGGTTRSHRRLRFWLHCFHVAALAELLDRDRGGGGSGAFTAGLLHDLGRVVLDQHYADVYEALLENEKDTGRLPVDVEEDLLGYHHGQIGFWLAEQWRFPPELSEAIRFHHRPSSSLGAARLTAVVHLADALIHNLEGGERPHECPREMHPYALAQLDLVPSQMAQYAEGFADIVAHGDEMVRELIGFTG